MIIAKEVHRTIRKDGRIKWELKMPKGTKIKIMVTTRMLYGYDFYDYVFKVYICPNEPRDMTTCRMMELSSKLVNWDACEIIHQGAVC